MSPAEILKQYVVLHNYGVESADFEPLMELFTVDAVFEFEDQRIGIFEGIEAIRRIFRLQPPEFMLGIKAIRESDESAIADYIDMEAPEKKLGVISIETEGDKITKVFIGK
jgi:hypothetical protein